MLVQTQSGNWISLRNKTYATGSIVVSLLVAASLIEAVIILVEHRNMKTLLKLKTKFDRGKELDLFLC